MHCGSQCLNWWWWWWCWWYPCFKSIYCVHRSPSFHRYATFFDISNTYYGSGSAHVSSFNYNRIDFSLGLWIVDCDCVVWLCNIEKIAVLFFHCSCCRHCGQFVQVWASKNNGIWLIGIMVQAMRKIENLEMNKLQITKSVSIHKAFMTYTVQPPTEIDKTNHIDIYIYISLTELTSLKPLKITVSLDFCKSKAKANACHDVNHEFPMD